MRLDIGAQGLKPLFIAGCCVTTIFLDLAFAAERYSRHSGRLAKNLGKAEKILSGLSSAFNCSPAQAWKVANDRSHLCHWRHMRFDTAIDFRYSTTSAIARWFPLIVYVCCHHTLHHGPRQKRLKLFTRAGYVISAIFICAEYQRLGVHFRQHRVLRASFWMKLAFILVERTYPNQILLLYHPRRCQLLISIH